MIVNANSILQLAIQVRNGITKLILKDYSWNLSTYICPNSKYLNSIDDTSVIQCEEICFGYCINEKVQIL